MYFIGVTTGASSIVPIFPRWANHHGLDEARLVGVDCPLDTDPDTYRRLVSFIKTDPLSRGALVTTHKIDLLRASRDLFDELDDDAELLDEISCISKRNGLLVGHAKDAKTGLLALKEFLPQQFWRQSGAEALFLGAGGATVALTSSLLTAEDRPARIAISDINPDRITEIRRIHHRIDTDVEVDYVVVDGRSDSDALVASLPRRSLVVNGTGMGKDRPGSPLSDGVSFPQDGYAWDYNYRGEFTFLKQAEAAGRNVTTVDGWTYFILGWTQIIAEVFDLAIPTSGSELDALATLAEPFRRR